MRQFSTTISFALCFALCLVAMRPALSAPAAGRADSDPCGTWRRLAPPEPGEHQVVAVRPPNGAQQIPSTHFIVHYDHDSLDAYAQSVSDAAELTYRVLVDTLSHVAPVSDGSVGGDARVDIYLRPHTALGSSYGVTYFGDPVGSPYPNTFTSWIELVDSMTTPRRVSVTAHEVYHTIHITYDRFESGSLFEMLATWVQDRVYDQYNLHYDFARLFFRQPHRGLFMQTYTNVPWAIYLTEQYGDGIMKETLEECAAVPGQNPREAFDAALQSFAGITFLDAFVDFGTFNYFVGGRDDGQHYSEGAAYFTTVLESRSLCYPQPLETNDFQPAELGANYVLLDGDGHSGPLQLYVFPEYLASTMVTMTHFKGATQTRTTTHYAAFSTPMDSIPINDWAECDSVLLVYQVNEGGSLNSLGYQARHTRAVIPAGTWMLVYDRDQCRAPFNGNFDQFRDRDSEETPFVKVLRTLGITVVVEDVLPPDLSSCRGIFLVGGFGESGVNISDADLTRLTTYMDEGGDIYVEGSRLGEYMDPSLGVGNATQQAFWSRFHCSFQPGAPTGNVGTWSTSGNPFMPAHQFTYDPFAPNAYVGELTPTGNADFLARDTGNKVRAIALRAEGGASTRIMATVLLGGSVGALNSAHEDFMGDVLDMFGTNVAALAVSRATVTVRERDVIIDGVLEHYDERVLSLARVDSEGRHEVALEIRRVGGEWRFAARDRLQTGEANYQLVDVENMRVLWEQRVEAHTPSYALRLTGIYPNPAREDVRIAVDSPSDERATIGVYDVAGREVAKVPATLRRGANVIYLGSLPGASGVYFVHIAAPSGTARGRLLVIR